MILNHVSEFLKIRRYIDHILIIVLFVFTVIKSQDRFNLSQSLLGVYYSSAGWGDYNKDGLLDLALTGVTSSGSSITHLFENSEEGLSQDLAQDIQAVFGGHLSWVDYNNDGHLDLTMTGFQVSNFFGGFKTSFYKWDNGIYIADTNSEIDIDLNYDGIGDNWVNGGVNGHHWGDYDNDGDLDYVQGGFDNYYRRHLDVFFNDNGILRLDTNQVHLIPINPAIVQWVDLDKDGNLDLVTIGADETETVMMRVYLNNSNNILTRGITWQSEIFGVTAGAIAFADYNSDGYDDFALSGLNSSGDPITYIAENNINTFIVTYILQGVYFGKLSWGDYDNDGDLDLLMTGQSSTEGDLGSAPITHVYKQIDNQFQLDETLSIDSVGISFSQWGDYDADGDLDLFLSGFKANEDLVAQVYDNLESLENPNNPPNVPYNLHTENLYNDTFNKVTISWNALDPENSNGSFTPHTGLRYHIQIGSNDENSEHAISTGVYGIGDIGTINRNEKTFRNIPAGNYKWRVRAIDHGYAVSEWSNWTFFNYKARVYPGDTDNNGIVNELDILPIGFHFHQLGHQRDFISYNWNGYYVDSWEIPSATYADCNGDGTINHLDVIGIGFNWSLSHENGLSTSLSISSQYQELIHQNLKNYIEIYNSLSGSSVAIDRIRNLLKTIISSEVPIEYSLKKNYPNPFNPVTTLRYDIPQDINVNITIYDMMGRQVKTLINGFQTSGYKSIQWDATNNQGESVSAGVYLYSIEAGDFRQTKKMILLK